MYACPFPVVLVEMVVVINFSSLSPSFPFSRYGVGGVGGVGSGYYSYSDYGVSSDVQSSCTTPVCGCNAEIKMMEISGRSFHIAFYQRFRCWTYFPVLSHFLEHLPNTTGIAGCQCPGNTCGNENNRTSGGVFQTHL